MDSSIIIVHGSQYEKLDEKLSIERGMELKRHVHTITRAFDLLNHTHQGMVLSGYLYRVEGNSVVSTPLLNMLEYAHEVRMSSSRCEECGSELATLIYQELNLCTMCARQQVMNRPPSIRLEGTITVEEEGDVFSVHLKIPRTVHMDKIRKGSTVVQAMALAISASHNSVAGPGLYTFVLTIPRRITDEDMKEVASKVDVALEWK